MENTLYLSNGANLSRNLSHPKFSRRLLPFTILDACHVSPLRKKRDAASPCGKDVFKVTAQV